MMVPVSSVALLDREMYSEAEASRLLGVAQNTLHYWLEGKTVGDMVYAPVIRLEILLSHWRAVERKLEEPGPFHLHAHSYGRPSGGQADLRRAGAEMVRQTPGGAPSVMSASRSTGPRALRRQLRL
jgi:hypothetical protein